MFNHLTKSCKGNDGNIMKKVMSVKLSNEKEVISGGEN